MNVDIQLLKDAIYRLKKNKVIKLQKDIARDTGYEEATISEILNEKQVLSEKFVRAFAKAYNLNVESLEKLEERKEISRMDKVGDTMTMDEIKNGFQLLYSELLKQMDKTNEISLILAETLKAKDREVMLNIQTMNKHAEIIDKLSDIIKEIAGENKLKKVLGKVI